MIAQGRLKQRSFETSNGEKRTDVELDVDELGASMRYATGRVSKATRSSGSQRVGETPGTDEPSF